MPVVGGVSIDTDNTCASVQGLQEFFGMSRDAHQIALLDNLKRYKEALLFDLSLLNDFRFANLFNPLIRLTAPSP